MAGTSQSGRPLSMDGEIDRLAEEAVECRGRIALSLQHLQHAVRALNTMSRRLVAMRERVSATQLGKAA